MTAKTGEEHIHWLAAQSPDLHVCTVCARYRAREGKPPAALLVEIELSKQLTPGKACVPIIPFLLTQNQINSMAAASLVVAIDDQFTFKESL